MSAALPGLSADKVFQLPRQTYKILMRFPEVNRVIGKVGHAATDPAGLETFETTIRFIKILVGINFFRNGPENNREAR